MNFRRLIPLALFLLLLAPATAGAASKKHKVSKVSLSVTAGSEDVEGVNETVQATFALPGGTTAAKACKGKVKFKAAVGSKYVTKHGVRVKQTVYAKGSGALAVGGKGCAASATLAISPVFLNKTTKFTTIFAGNTVLKPFVKTTKMKVRIPSTPLTPTAGPWTMRQTGAAAGAGQQWSFSISPTSWVGAVKRLTDMTVQCLQGNSFTVLASPTEMSPFNTPFRITQADVFARDDDFAGGAAMTTSSLTLKFDSPSHATGYFQLTGNLGAPPIVYGGCDTGKIPVELQTGSFL